METNKFQRVGSISNAHVGREFEKTARTFFQEAGILLTRDFAVPIGVGDPKKDRKFDLGSEDPPVLVECKSHTWTQGNNIPSAKITVWNESMYYFHIAPSRFRKIFFVLEDYCEKRGKTLAEYYLQNYMHLIPDGVEFWEFDSKELKAKRVH